MKARFLTFFSYIGTNFRSAEKVWLKDKSNLFDLESVQGLMEIGLLKLKPKNQPKVVLSSRTDGGVHALKCSAHIDLERNGVKVYEAECVINVLNSFFNKNSYPVTIRHCLRVSDNFHARFHALSRSYLYRFAVLKKEHTLPEYVNLTSLIPIEEWRRCHYYVLPDFDLKKFKAAATYFQGYHDFTSFKKFDKLKQHKHNRRELLSVDVKPGQPNITSYSLKHQKNLFDYYELHICGKGFVHNQIRRMLGAMIAVSMGKIPLEEIQLMLQVPSKHSWPTSLWTAPPYGLYLCDVQYDPKDLVYDPEKIQDSDSESDCE